MKAAENNEFFNSEGSALSSCAMGATWNIIYNAMEKSTFFKLIYNAL